MIGVLLAKMLARRSYDAINRGDITKLMASWHEDATLTYPGALSVSGTRRGKDAIEAWFRHFQQQVPTRDFRPTSIAVQNIFDVVGTNVIAVEWDNRPVNKAGEQFYVRGVTVSTTRRGKIMASTTYVFDYELLPKIWGESES
jgi:ketosteroid isomerase-like protein